MNKDKTSSGFVSKEQQAAVMAILRSKKTRVRLKRIPDQDNRFDILKGKTKIGYLALSRFSSGEIRVHMARINNKLKPEDVLSREAMRKAARKNPVAAFEKVEVPMPVRIRLVRGLARALKSEHPQMKNITGIRITGVRNKKLAQKEQELMDQREQGLLDEQDYEDKMDGLSYILDADLKFKKKTKTRTRKRN